MSLTSEKAPGTRAAPLLGGYSGGTSPGGITELVRDITAETRRRLREAGVRSLGRRRILRQNPHARPRRIARSAAPRFHAASWPIRKMLEAGYRSYLDAYREAKQALASQQLSVRFPSHGIPPPGVGVAVPV